MCKQRFFTKYISILQRLTNRFYDHELTPYLIGSGQHFFLLRIHENEGISMYDLARLGHFDKGTVTKGIQKLEEQDYIRSEADPADRRIRRLYTTEKAMPVISELQWCRKTWNDVITEGLTPEEMDLAEHLLQKMAENAYLYICSENAVSVSQNKK